MFSIVSCCGLVMLETISPCGFGKGPGEGSSYFDVARGKMVVASLSDGAMFGCMFVGDGKEIGDVLIGERVKLGRP